MFPMIINLQGVEDIKNRIRFVDNMIELNVL